MKTRRIYAGRYEVDTAKGTFTVEHVPAHNGYPSSWFITWPGERHADEAVPTLRAAKNAIAHEHANAVTDTLTDTSEAIMTNDTTEEAALRKAVAALDRAQAKLIALTNHELPEGGVMSAQHGAVTRAESRAFEARRPFDLSTNETIAFHTACQSDADPIEAIREIIAARTAEPIEDGRAYGVRFMTIDCEALPMVADPAGGFRFGSRDVEGLTFDSFGDAEAACDSYCEGQGEHVAEFIRIVAVEG
jgi:hypothetical protein